MIAVGPDKFAVFARGDLSDKALGLMKGDVAEVQGALQMVAWTVPGKGERARMSVDAKEVTLLCRKELRLNS